MGNNFRSIAQYCDCLETPWERYQPPQQSQSSHSQQKHSKNSTKSQQNSGVHEDKHVIFDHPLQENSSEMKIVPHLNSRTFDNLSGISCETPEVKQPDEMSIIDLEKIDSTIKHEAKIKARHKGHTQPLIIQEHPPASISGEENQKAEDTLSNMFEQKNAKYFIDNDEAQFYRIGMRKQHKY